MFSTFSNPVTSLMVLVDRPSGMSEGSVGVVGVVAIVRIEIYPQVIEVALIRMKMRSPQQWKIQ